MKWGFINLHLGAIRNLPIKTLVSWAVFQICDLFSKTHDCSYLVPGMSGTFSMSGGDRKSDFVIQNYQGDNFVNVFLHYQVNSEPIRPPLSSNDQPLITKC